MMMMKEELIAAANEMVAGEVADLTTDELRRLMTVTQFVTDLCLNEIEQRGELTWLGDLPIIPYQSDHFARHSGFEIDIDAAPTQLQN